MVDANKIASLVAKLDDRYESLENKTTSWGQSPSDDKYPSEKLVADSLAAQDITLEKLFSAETGYAHSYVIKKDNVQIGPTINIPKDYLVKSATVDVVESADLATLGQGYAVGDKYMDFIVNTKGNDGTDEHIYVNVKDLVEDTTYDADEVTLTLNNGTFSIKAGGVDTTQLKDEAVTTAKIDDEAVTLAKIDPTVSGAWLDIEDVDDEIEDYIDALIAAL